jgi:hypothetical protein
MQKFVVLSMVDVIIEHYITLMEYTISSTYESAQQCVDPFIVEWICARGRNCVCYKCKHVLFNVRATTFEIAFLAALLYAQDGEHVSGLKSRGKEIGAGKVLDHYPSISR